MNDDELQIRRAECDECDWVLSRRRVIEQLQEGGHHRATDNRIREKFGSLRQGHAYFHRGHAPYYVREDEPTEDLAVSVNDNEVLVPNDFGSSAEEFVAALGWDDSVREYDVYRLDGTRDGARLAPEDKCDEPMVVSEGDRFAVVPRYVGGA